MQHPVDRASRREIERRIQQQREAALARKSKEA